MSTSSSSFNRNPQKSNLYWPNLAFGLAKKSTVEERKWRQALSYWGSAGKVEGRTFLYRPTERCREKVDLSACRGNSHIPYDNVPPTTRHYLLTFVNCVLRQQQVHWRDQRERVTAIKNVHISQPAKLSIRTLPSCHATPHDMCAFVYYSFRTSLYSLYSFSLWTWGFLQAYLSNLTIILKKHN